MYVRALIRMVPVLAIVAVPACSEDSTEPSFEDEVDHVVRLLGASFSPADLVVQPGESVGWINDGDIAHNITPKDPQQQGVWQAQSTTVAGPVFKHTFTIPGAIYEYSCTLHEGMEGRIRVADT